MRFPSAEWFEAYMQVINSSEAYRRAAASWEGDVCYVVEAEPDRGVPEEVWAWADLWHGECREVRIVSPERGVSAKFVIRGPYSRWREVIEGRLEPVKAIMQGRLKLTGDLPAIVKHMAAAKELVTLASSMPTEFPG